PEFLGRAVEGGAAADYGPELPSELAAQVAEGPPAPQKVLALGGGVTHGKTARVVTGLCPVLAGPFGSAQGRLRFVLAGRSPATTQASKTFVCIAFDLLLQRLDHARDGHQHGDTLAPDRRHDFGGVEGVFEYDRTA